MTRRTVRMLCTCALATVVPASASTSGGANHPHALAFDASGAPASAQQRATMVRIAGGAYPMGAPSPTAPSASDALPLHRVQLAPFRIDRTEVTNRAFAEYLNALAIRPHGNAAVGRATAANFAAADRPLFLESHVPREVLIIALDDDEVRIGIRDGRFVAAPGFDEHPVAEVTWAGAAGYCAWRGARLPSEAEWEAAARGLQGRRFPWGDAMPDATRATIGRRSGDTAPVGSAPAGATPEGVQDLAGSLAEWTSSLYRPYPYRADDGREDPRAAGERVTRGGDYVFQSAPEHLVSWHRRGFSRATDSGHRHIGFRCVHGEPSGATPEGGDAARTHDRARGR